MAHTPTTSPTSELQKNVRAVSKLRYAAMSASVVGDVKEARVAANSPITTPPPT